MRFCSSRRRPVGGHVVPLLPYVLAWAATLGAVATVEAQAPPPADDWLSIRTEHFRVTYRAGLDSAAARAAMAAERTHALLREMLAGAPRGTIELVVTDHVDFTNGYATPFPSNRVVVFARPPVDVPQLAYTRDWIELVVAHEVVHIFHMDVTGGVGRLVRGVFGRLPMVWPVFPIAGTPNWSLEGLATYYESLLTGGGRAYGSFHEMVARVAALESRIPDLDELSAPNPLWPGGQRSYIYGSLFKRWLAETQGPDVHAAIVESTARSWLPTFLFFNHVSRAPTGSGFRALYEEWRAETTAEARRLRDELAWAGTSETEAVVGAPPFAVAPRVSRDGARLSFGAHDLRSDPSTQVLDVATGRVARLARRNRFGGAVGPAPWLPDGSGVVVAELEYRDRYRIEADLWRLTDDRAERVTRGHRLSQPDVAGDGRIVAVRNNDGALDLVTVDAESGAVTTLVASGSGEAFMRPRWSPDGRTVAVALLRDGRVDLVVVDAASGRVTPLTNDDALDGAPAWSPDGTWLIWWSDRTGIPNLFALEMDGPAATTGTVRQVSNVVGGLFDPEVSPDGRWIYVAAYHADGWHIERLPFDPSTWAQAPAPGQGYRPGLMPPPAGPTLDLDAATPYSALPSVLPKFWLPYYGSTAYDERDPDHLRFLGAYSFGWDVLMRHEWEGWLAAELGSGRFAGSGRWTWNGLGQPSLSLRADRTWSRAGILQLPDSRETVYQREDNFGLEAVVRRPRWRSHALLAASGDLRWRAYDLHSLDRQTLASEDPPDLVGLALRPAYTNARVHPLSISREDGVSISMGARRWWTTGGMDRAYDQLQAQLAGYRGFHLNGFANHVAATRVSGVARLGPLATVTGVGGAAGAGSDLGLGAPTIGGSSLLLPVRGFDEGAIAGTRAWTASGEYRLPIYLFGYRAPILGLSLTAVSASFFVDAGDAWCSAAEIAAQLLACPQQRTGPGAPQLLSTGAELNLDAGVLHDARLRVRGGVALPLRGPLRHPDEARLSPRNWQLYLRFGPSF